MVEFFNTPTFKEKLIGDIRSMINTYTISTKFRFVRRNTNRGISAYHYTVGNTYNQFGRATDLFPLETIEIDKLLHDNNTYYSVIFSFPKTRAFLSLSPAKQRILIIDLHHAIKSGLSQLLKVMMPENAKLKQYLTNYVTQDIDESTKGRHNKQ